MYATKCMKYLRFLDYTTLEARGKTIEAKLREKDRELHDMKEKYESERVDKSREIQSDHGIDTTKSSVITSKTRSTKKKTVNCSLVLLDEKLL